MWQRPHESHHRVSWSPGDVGWRQGKAPGAEQLPHFLDWRHLSSKHPARPEEFEHLDRSSGPPSFLHLWTLFRLRNHRGTRHPVNASHQSIPWAISLSREVYRWGALRWRIKANLRIGSIDTVLRWVSRLNAVKDRRIVAYYFRWQCNVLVTANGK